MKQTRREFIKTNAVAATAAAAGITIPGVQAVAAENDKDIRWDKAPCRFCGTGCSVLVGTKGDRVVATQGDPDAPVNRGLNCIKGYFLSKIMYGDDRVTQPLLRKKNGKFHKEGDFEPVSWDEAFDIMEEKWKAAIKNDLERNKGLPPEKVTSSVGMFGSGQWTVFEGYAASKLYKAGFRSNNIDPNARHCMASAVGAFIRAFGADEPMGCYDDLEHADAFVLWGSNMAEMHPILWSRLTDTRLTKPGTEVHVLSTFEHRSFELADHGVIFKPQTDLAILNYIANYIVQQDAVNWDFVNKHVNFTKTPTDIGYGLRPEDPRQKAAKNANKGKLSKIDFEQYKKDLAPYTAEHVSELSGVSVESLEKLAKLYADPNKKVVSYWTMGFQPAHAWCLGERPDVQRASADRQDLGAGQWPVLADRPAVGLRNRARDRYLCASPAGRPGGVQETAPRFLGKGLATAGWFAAGQEGFPRRTAEPDAQRRQAELLLGDDQQQYAGRTQRQ